MFKFMKNLFEDYKSYKEEKIQDSIETNAMLSQHRAEVEKRINDRLTREEELIAKNVIYDRENNVYRFEVTVKYEGKPQTFSCEDRDEESCRNVAPFVLLRAQMYESFGGCDES